MNLTELAMSYKFVKQTSGGGSGGGSGIIDVTELPTENIDENAVYRVNGYANANVFCTGHVFGGEPVAFADFVKNFVAGATIEYFVADTTPENPQESDFATFTVFYVYIVNNVALAYGNAGEGNTWMPLSTLLSGVLGEYLVAPLEDKGYIESKYQIPMNDEVDYDCGVYVTYKKNQIAIASNEKLVYFRNEWVNIKDLFLSSPCFLKELTADDFANITFITPYMFSKKVKYVTDDGTLFAGGIDTSLEKVTIPAHIRSICDHAFESNHKLSSVVIEKGELSYIGTDAFAFCVALTEIRYMGTKAEWKAIRKDEFWCESGSNYTIYCTDGTIAKDGTET